MIKKTCILIIILVLLSFSLYGCYDAYSIEEYAYVIAIGIDKGNENALKLTLQFAIPSSASSGGSSNQSDKTTITEVECSSIDSGLATINSYVSKIINLSHCQIIAISETVAEQGIEKYIDTLTNNIEIRPDCDILITRCDASDFMNSSNPILTNLTARYYQVLLNSEEYTGYTAKSPIWKIATSSPNMMSQYVAILAGLNLEGKQPSSNDNLSLIDKDVSLKPGETPIINNTKSQVMGLAVFNDNKLVGELTAIESICYLILKNELQSCHIAIPSPFNPEESIDLTLKINNNSESKVKLVNNTPFITCNVELSAFIQSYSEDSNYSTEGNIKIVEEYASSYIKSKLTEFLYKTAKEFHSDIVGFGYKTSLLYSNIPDWENSNWYHNYKNSFFEVNVNTEIIGSSLFTKH